LVDAQTTYGRTQTRRRDEKIKAFFFGIFILEALLKNKTQKEALDRRADWLIMKEGY